MANTLKYSDGGLITSSTLIYERECKEIFVPLPAGARHSISLPIMQWQRVAAHLTSPRKQLWRCFACDTDRVYGLDVPWDVLDRTEKQLDCSSCEKVTAHHFLCVSKTDL